MTRHAEPVRTAAAPKTPDRHGPAAAAPGARCLGPAAQLAAVHRTLTGGAPLQLKTVAAAAGRRADAAADAKPSGQAANRTVLPDRLKAGLEALPLGAPAAAVQLHAGPSGGAGPVQRKIWLKNAPLQAIPATLLARLTAAATKRLLAMIADDKNSMDRVFKTEDELLDYVSLKRLPVPEGYRPLSGGPEEGPDPTHSAAGAGSSSIAASSVASVRAVKVDTGEHRTSDGPMSTDGLENCIAIVASRPGLACLYHYNTAGSFKPDSQDRLFADEENIQAAKHLVDDAITPSGGPAMGATSYHIVLGKVWDSNALHFQPAPRREEGLWRGNKERFVAALAKIFRPVTLNIEGHRTANWNPPTLTGTG